MESFPLFIHFYTLIHNLSVHLVSRRDKRSLRFHYEFEFFLLFHAVIIFHLIIMNLMRARIIK